MRMKLCGVLAAVAAFGCSGEPAPKSVTTAKQQIYQRPPGAPLGTLSASDVTLKALGVTNWEVYKIGKADVLVGVDASNKVVADIRVRPVLDSKTQKPKAVQIWTMFPNHSRLVVDVVNNRVLEDTFSKGEVQIKLREALTQDFSKQRLSGMSLTQDGKVQYDSCFIRNLKCAAAILAAVAAAAAVATVCVATAAVPVVDVIACGGAIAGYTAALAVEYAECSASCGGGGGPLLMKSCGCGGCGGCGCGGCGCGGCGCGCGGGGPLLEKEATLAN